MVVITTLLVDAHVHYHACFGIEAFLDAALANFRAARREADDPRALGCLMFTESSWSHYFRAFTDGLIERSTEGWAVEPTAEDCSIVARRNDNERLVLIAGRQIVTSNRLEVLALATLEEYPDDVPIREAIDRGLATGAVTVLPWGFGKWVGARGRIVKETLTSPLAERLYVGDNGGRPRLVPEPALFRLARDAGVPILRGTDPLPLPPEVRKPGRFGFMLKGRFAPEAPAAAIREMLTTRSQPRPFGRLEGLVQFMHRQVALRLRPKDRSGEVGRSGASAA
jgi:hypothetical protein